MKAICKRELKALLGSLRGWGYAAIVLLGAAVSVLLNNVIAGTPRFEVNVYYIALTMIPATALITAGSFQKENRQNTERLLYSLPLKNKDIVLGKMIALMVPVGIACAALCVLPLMLTPFCEIALLPAYSSILALLCIGFAMMAISAASRHWFTAFLGTVGVLAASWGAPYAAEIIGRITTVTLPVMAACMVIAFTATYVLTSNATLGIVMAGIVEIPTFLAHLQGTGARLMKAVAGGVRNLSLFEGLNSFINGMADISVLVMYLAVAAMFTFVAVLCVGNRRQAKRRAL